MKEKNDIRCKTVSRNGDRHFLNPQYSMCKNIQYLLHLVLLWEISTYCQTFMPNFNAKKVTSFCHLFVLIKFKNGPFFASFLYLRLFYIQLTVNNRPNKSCRWLDSSPGRLVWKMPRCQMCHNHCRLLIKWIGRHNMTIRWPLKTCVYKFAML